jgi:precorrin-2 dehydrogenase/sirohydrochlorin ferrochelatase
VSLIPLGFEGESLTAVVVGGGKVGARRALSLANAGACVTVIAPEISDDLVPAPKLSIQRREYAGPNDIAQANLVVAATNSRAVNERVKSDAMQVRVPVNVADAGDDGNFIFLAAHHEGPVTIGVSAGRVPNAAARIRDLIAQRIDRRYAEAVAECSQIRERLLASGGTGEWHVAASKLIDDEFCTRVENGTFSEKAAQWR